MFGGAGGKRADRQPLGHYYDLLRHYFGIEWVNDLPLYGLQSFWGIGHIIDSLLKVDILMYEYLAFILIVQVFDELLGSLPRDCIQQLDFYAVMMAVCLQL